MNKMMMAVAGLAMAVALTGCGGSPKGVAEDFVNAIIQRETDKALKYVDTTTMSAKEVKNLKEALDNAGKDINDNKLEVESILEVVEVPAEDKGYTLVNGAKYTKDSAQVNLQFMKGKDKKSDGRGLQLGKVDGAWKVKVGVRETMDKEGNKKFVLDGVRTLSDLDTDEK